VRIQFSGRAQNQLAHFSDQHQVIDVVQLTFRDTGRPPARRSCFAAPQLSQYIAFSAHPPLRTNAHSYSEKTVPTEFLHIVPRLSIYASSIQFNDFVAARCRRLFHERQSSVVGRRHFLSSPLLASRMSRLQEFVAAISTQFHAVTVRSSVGEFPQEIRGQLTNFEIL